MRIEKSLDGAAFIVRIVGEKQPSAVYRSVGSIVFLAWVEMILRHSRLRAAGVIVGGTFAIYNICDVQFGISEMRVEDYSITFTRKIAGLKRSRTFPRSDVEKLGYLKGNDKEYPALGMMVRTLIMPFHFGKGISYEEAKKLLEVISMSDSWLAGKTLNVDRPLF